MRVFVCVLAACFAAAPSAAAQSGPVAAPCPYEVCGLRAEPSLLGVRLVAGERGETVARSGLFGVVHLADVVAASPDALLHARSYERTHLQSALVGLAAGALVGASLSGVGSDEFQTGALVGGVGLAAVGLTLELRSRRSFSRAVWEFNRGLPQGR